MELNKKIESVDVSNSSSLEEIQLCYSNFNFETESDLTILTDCSDVTELTQDRIISVETEINKVITDINKNSVDLLSLFNSGVISLDSLLKEVQSLGKSLSATRSQGKYNILFQEPFNSSEYLNLGATNGFVDLGLGIASSGLESSEAVDYLPVLGEKTSQGAIPGCNALSTTFKIDKETGAVSVEKEPNQSFCILNLSDGDPTSCFEMELYFVKRNQPIKKSTSNTYSDGGKNIDVSPLIPKDDNTITIKNGSKSEDKTLLNISSEKPVDKFYVNLKLILPEPKEVNSITINPLFRRGFSHLKIESVKILVNDRWVSIKEAQVIKGTVVLGLNSILPTDQIDLLFSTDYVDTGLIYKEFETTKFLRKSTRSHGLWRTVDKWESWERSPNKYSSKSIDIYSPTLLSSSGETYVPQSLFKGNVNLSPLNPVSALSTYYTYKDVLTSTNSLFRTTRALGNINKSSKELNNVLTSITGGKSSHVKSGALISSLIPSGISSALGVYSGVLAVADTLQNAFSYNHQKTPENSIISYDIFFGWRAGIAIKDIEVHSNKYLSQSAIISSAIPIKKKVTKVGITVEADEAPGVIYRYFLSEDGINWIQTEDVKANPTALVYMDSPKFIYYKILIESTSGNRGVVSTVTLIEQ